MYPEITYPLGIPLEIKLLYNSSMIHLRIPATAFEGLLQRILRNWSPRRIVAQVTLRIPQRVTQKFIPIFL